MVGVILYRYNPSQYVLMPKCPFKLLTGLNCPGCGIQRAVHSLLHGHFIDAVKYNLFLVYAGPYAIFVGINQLVIPPKYSRKIAIYLEHKYLVNFYVITFFIWFVIRNILNI